MTNVVPDDLDPLEASLLGAIAGLSSDSATTGERAGTEPVDALTAATVLEAEITSRVIDHTARWLRANHGLGYYTIGSAGHESNAAVAMALRPTDPALLHYRSGGFYVARAMQAQALGLAGTDPIQDILRGMLARSTEPIAGGRHKVFGHHDLSIIPQTSTIASHLPRAVGLALSFSVAPSAPTSWPVDSVVVCSFGDGSLNHSTAQGAINWAAHAAAEGRSVPILFVCEDNGIGLSVPSPDRWVDQSLHGRPGFVTAAVDGDDPASVLQTTSDLVGTIRSTGRPGVLQLRTVRFLGHAGTDVESAYRSPAELEADRARDPIIGAAALAVGRGVCSADDVVEWYLDLRSSVRASALALCSEPELTTADEIMAPLDALRPRPAASPAPSPRPTTGPPPASHAEGPLTLAQTINRALGDHLDAADDTIVFGEDVGRKGGVYGVTRGLQKRFGTDRVFDTLLDEQSVLGLALGSAVNGRLPIPEIQYLAYLHNAEDQLRGEAATLSFFSQGQYRNPMVVRVASYGYQKGFGGHFHNDNSITVLRDIPGLVIASPAHPGDAAGMLHGCLAHARATGAVCVYLEPIARYHDADLHETNDGGWTAPYDPTPIDVGEIRTWPSTTGNEQLTILTWGNGLHMSLQAQRRLGERGVSVAVVDLRWLAPLPIDALVMAARRTGRVLIVDETRDSGGVGEGIVAGLVERGFDGAIGRVAGRDSFVPLGAAANLVLVSVDQIVSAATALTTTQRT